MKRKDSAAEPMLFEDAVALFRERGFTVEPGPLQDEITLIACANPRQGYTVVKAEMLRDLAQEIFFQSAVNFIRPAETPCGCSTVALNGKHVVTIIYKN